MVTRFDVKFCKTRISEYLLAEIWSDQPQSCTLLIQTEREPALYWRLSSGFLPWTSLNSYELRWARTREKIKRFKRTYNPPKSSFIMGTQNCTVWVLDPRGLRRCIRRVATSRGAVHCGFCGNIYVTRNLKPGGPSEHGFPSGIKPSKCPARITRMDDGSTW